jgi:hypothetical protein
VGRPYPRIVWRERRVKSLTGIIAAIPILLLFGCSHKTRDAAKSRSAYLQEVAAIHRAGLPVYPGDLKKTPPPPERNAAPLYQALPAIKNSKPLPETAEETLGYLYSRKTPTPEQLAAGRQLLTSRKDILRAIHDAISLPDCDFRHNWALGPALTLPDSDMRSATRWISAESALFLLDGKPIDAVNNLALGFRIGKHVSKDPIIIAYLVGVATDSITLAGLEKVLYLAGEKTGVAEAVSASIVKNWKPNSLAHAMGGEFVTQTVSLEMLRRGGLDEFRKEMGVSEENFKLLYTPGAGDWQPWVDDNGIFMLEITRKTTQSCELPYPESHRIMTGVNAEKESGIKRDMSIAYMILPDSDQLLVKRASIQARMDIDRTAAKLIAWKQHHGRFPEKLGQAIPSVPADPFDLKPLRYRREGSGFVLYSIGETGKFDGGTVAVKPDAKESLFRYPRPAYMDQGAKPN